MGGGGQGGGEKQGVVGSRAWVMGGHMVIWSKEVVRVEGGVVG